MRAFLVSLAVIVLIVVDVAAMYALARWWGAVALVKRTITLPEATTRNRWILREAGAGLWGIVIVSVPLHVLFLVVLVIAAAVSNH